MKSIIKIDWVCQTILVIIVIGLLIAGDFENAWAFASNLLIWQTASAITLLVMNHGRGPRRLLFLAGVFGYCMSIVTSIEIIIIVLPVILISCYWLLTTCNLYSNMKYHKGRFLPHTSF